MYQIKFGGNFIKYKKTLYYLFCVIEFLKKRIIFINKMKKILVTGGSGFIGTNLINYYSNKNKYIINFDKLTYASTPEKFKKKIFKKKTIFLKKLTYQVVMK